MLIKTSTCRFDNYSISILLFKKKHCIVPIFLIAACILQLKPATGQNFSRITTSGYITDAETGEALIGVTVFVKQTNSGTITNRYGFYSVSSPSDTTTIQISFIGYKTEFIKPVLKGTDKTCNIALKPETSMIEEIKVSAENKTRDMLESAQGNIVRIPVKQIQQLPGVLGETDVVKALQLMPGISPGGEGVQSIFVRGGEADQNLVILDEAVVYNVGHLLGFFSVFNTDAVKDVKMYKGGFPAAYGGRLSSVLDISMKEGDINRFHCLGSVGLLSSKIAVEGPLIKEKMSFIVSARRTYVDKLFKLLGQPLPYYFYDMNAKLNYKTGNRDRLFISTYLGQDVLNISSDDGTVSTDTTADGTPVKPEYGFDMGNQTLTLRWNHLYNSRMFSNFSIIYNRFRYDVNAEDGINSLVIRSSVNDIGFKSDFDLNIGQHHKLEMGMMMTRHLFHPNVVFAKGDIADLVENQQGKSVASVETGWYVLDEMTLSAKTRLNAGMRLSSAITGKNTYSGAEPRIMLVQKIDEQRSLKLGYARMIQYVHRISGSNFVLPTDMYYPVTQTIKPAVADQVSVTFTRQLAAYDLLLSVEGYQKWMKNLIEFKEGTRLFLNNEFEKDLLRGKGNSFGFEVMLQRNEGVLSGWVSYTLSWARRYFDELNEGISYFSRNDRRHNFSAVAMLTINPKWNLSLSWIYMTGARFTPVLGQYMMPNPSNSGIEIIPVYAPLNSVVMSPVHRLDVDFSYTPAGRHRYSSEWHFGIYNLYNRAAPYRIEIVYDQRGYYKYVQPGLFGRILSVAYNFKF